MTAILFLLRQYWKPLAMVLAALWIYNAGYSSASRACKAASLNAEITELKRQNTAKQNVLAQAEKDRRVREFEIENLTKKVDDYENDIGKNNACILTDAGAKRLRAIR